MREWIDEISDYLQKREEIPPPLSDFSEEIHQAALETDLLLQVTGELEMAVASVLEKMEHATSHRAPSSHRHPF